MRDLKIKLIDYFFDRGMNNADEIIAAVREITDDELMRGYVDKFVAGGREVADAVEDARKLVEFVNE